MKNRKNIIIILSIVLVMALLIEIARTEYLFKLGSNNNEHYSSYNSQKQDSLSKDEVDRFNREKFLVIYDKRSEESIRLKDTIIHVLSYMKKINIECDIEEFEDINENYRTVILAFDKLKDFKGIEDVVNYVSNGGKVFFAMRPMEDGVFYNLHQKLGIYEVRQWTGDAGIKLVSNLLIKGEGYTVDDELVYNNMINAQIRKECKLYAVSNKGIPMLWDVPYGSGKFMIFNGTILGEKMNRGIIAGAISLLNKDFLYPVMNIKLSFMDDFPAPIPLELSDHFENAYGRSIQNFYREIWWSDILKGAKNYDLKYSSMVIQTYNDSVEPPFENKIGIDLNSLIVYGREIIKSGGELGIHGYNHQPLVQKGFIDEEMGYKPWVSQDDMVASLLEVKSYINKVFPKYVLRSYVPPSNILSSAGRQAIKNAFPDLKIISSLYLEDPTKTAYIQEFEVSDDGIVELPRITHGYVDNEEINWCIINAITSIGVFSHFVHPDDLLDIERSEGKTWEVMSKEYNSLLKKVYDNYKWLRSMTVSQGGIKVKDFLECETFVEYKDEYINVYCNNFTEDIYFILRTDKKPIAEKDCEVFKIDKDAFLIRAKKPYIKITLSR